MPSGQFLAWALDHLIRVSTQMDKARLHFFEFSGGGERFLFMIHRWELYSCSLSCTLYVGREGNLVSVCPLPRTSLVKLEEVMSRKI